MTTKEKKKTTNWAELAQALPSDEFQVSIPVRVMIVEALAAASFVDKNWATVDDPKTKAIVKLGLETAGDHLSKSIADEIRELVPLVTQANFDLERTVDPKSPTAATMARGRAIVDEITATLEWLFDDGVEDEHDAELAAIEAAHRDDPQTADAVALALEDFAKLAEPQAKKMQGLGGFDAAVIEEAHAVAAALRAAPTIPGFAASPASRAAMGVRNRYLQLLSDRVERVRKAARFVYRDDPKAASGALSTYVQRRRTVAKRVAARKGKPAGDASAQPTTATQPVPAKAATDARPQ